MSAKGGLYGKMRFAAGSSRKHGRERIRDERELDIPERTVTDILARLSRAEGQVRAVKRMITERRDCHAIAHQNGRRKRRTFARRGTAHDREHSAMPLRRRA